MSALANDEKIISVIQHEFDFDEMSALAKSDPLAFERRRAELIDQACERLGGGEQPYIAGILCRIEIERSRCMTPLKSCIRLSTLMWERFF